MGAEEGGAWGKGVEEGGEWERGRRRGEMGERGRKRGGEWGKEAEGARVGKGGGGGGRVGKGGGGGGRVGKGDGRGGRVGKGGGSRVGEQRGFGGGGRALVNNRKRIITKRFETFNSFHFNTLNSLKDLLIPYKLALDESSFTSSPFDARKEPDVTRQFLIDSFSVKFFSCLTDQKQVRTLNAFQVCPHVLIG